MEGHDQRVTANIKGNRYKWNCFSFPAVKTLCIDDLPLPVAFANLRMLHLVEPSSGFVQAIANIATRSSGMIVFGRPLPGLSVNPAIPSSKNLLRHKLTIFGVRPFLIANRDNVYVYSGDRKSVV
jgi:hypothetical protein